MANEDRLSALADDILWRILYFVPFKEAASTIVLSLMLVLATSTAPATGTRSATWSHRCCQARHGRRVGSLPLRTLRVIHLTKSLGASVDSDGFQVYVWHSTRQKMQREELSHPLPAGSTLPP
ncbi:unnamed protein product [Urochloa humidicola]